MVRKRGGSECVLVCVRAGLRDAGLPREASQAPPARKVALKLPAP